MGIQINGTNDTITASSGTISTPSNLSPSGTSTFSGITTVTGTTLFAKQLNLSGISTFNDNIVLANGKGIDFSATANSSGTMTSELLSDYEEGTWTPVDADGDAYTTNKLSTYTRVGRLVWAMCDVSATSTANGSKIGGLPFTAFGQSGSSFAGNYPCFNGYTSGPDARMNGHINSGTTQITLFVGSTETSLTNGQRIIITALYLA